MTSRSRKSLSLKEKVCILKKVYEKQHLKRVDLAKELRLPVSTLNTLIYKRKIIEESHHESGFSASKKVQSGKFADVEKVLLQWFNQCRSVKIPISGPLLMEKAREISKQLNENCDASFFSGWLHKFKLRHDSRQNSCTLAVSNLLQACRFAKQDCCELKLLSSLELATRRLESTTKKLLHGNLYDAYEGIFLEWLYEGIIEEVPVDEINLSGNYLPYRPVLKESSTTPIRPVFDAYARMKGHPSLNKSLHSGPKLIELIPDILLRFR
ncbi:hypothetical protein AVEN_18658-1 [Araneus ventricosus]|uniref:HTH CENPB-type domain-containing protein n=1 Tax=Araneus ventricosus TaxID=182803 RepID=A0A4Y2RQ53_ARAVE|nr:hypothetical protein AVEN_18658-1 [Araneus ventricosus]